MRENRQALMDFAGIKTQYELYKKEIDNSIHQVLDDGHFIMGKQIMQLEDALAKFVGVKHAIAVSSGTDSLLIALMALNIEPGDEVITVPFTWISTVEVIALLGAKPVFVDINPDTYHMDVKKIKEAMTSKTKALLPVSLFGQMPDYAAINRIAAEYDIPVIEDGAQSFGAQQHGKRSCGLTTIGSTSFFPTKPLGAYGDGGALFTNDDLLAKKMRAIRTHGSDIRHHHFCLGLNGRLDTIQAAILLVKLAHFHDEIKLRQEVGARYSKMLKDHCSIPGIQEGNTHIYSTYTIRLENRNAVARALEAKGIPTSLYYPKCIHEQPAFHFLGKERGSFPIAEKASDEVLSLPMHPWLTEEEQNLVVETIILNSQPCVPGRV